ncbi:MAG TPA: heavy metal translocating P-type ATPase, partial [Pirellulales bacterium]|nr:heavy metal translocating P-type ATPase [Pirellulales bacterium]
QAIERELTSVLGVDHFKTNPLTSSVLIVYDPKILKRAQVIEILDRVLESTEHPKKKDRPDLHLPLCTASIPLAAAAQFVFPPLLPVAAGVFLYTSIPTFKSAREVLFKERRLGVDVLDSLVVVGCAATMSILPGTVLCWCLSFGRVLVKKTEDNSKKLLLNAFGKQPRYVWLYVDGAEMQTPLEKLEAGDTIVVHTGETVPVDGVIKEGMAMIDQHALTGESTPAEKGPGDRVFAATLMVAGKVFVTVEKAGSETASAKISQILNDTAGYKLRSQHRGEQLADKAVVPMMITAAAGWSMLGSAGAVAILNSDFGTGIRIAAPLGMLSSLALCAHKGILIKDGRALELMNGIDTVLFDKTGTLTRERPEVGRIHVCHGHSPERVVAYAAAAEQKFHHPIAQAILHKATEMGLRLPATDESRYQVGYGITVGVEGHSVRVGSARFMEMDGIELPDEIRQALDDSHREGNTLVMVAVDDRLGGALELQAAVRPEVVEIVQGLRKRGIKHIAIISGDHEAPTKKLAEALGMDRYFAQVLPADKADYVEKLQKEGRKVCFVGDGINDSIALKKANVSISLRGASSIATDTAQIVFLEEGLSKLCDLRDIASGLDQNVRRSWHMILAPNIACIVGAFTFGFGIMTSVVTNNVTILAVLANALAPLREAARLEAQKARERDLRAAAAQASLAAITVEVADEPAPQNGLRHPSQNGEAKRKSDRRESVVQTV